MSLSSCNVSSKFFNVVSRFDSERESLLAHVATEPNTPIRAMMPATISHVIFLYFLHIFMFPSLRRAQKRSYSSLLGCSVCAASVSPSPMTYATTEAADMIQPVTVSAVSAEPPKAIIKPDTSPTVAIQSFLLVNFLIQSIFRLILIGCYVIMGFSRAISRWRHIPLEQKTMIDSMKQLGLR